MPVKLLGFAFIFAGLLLRRQFVRARQRGYVGPAYRPVRRLEQRLRFNLALGSHAIGAVICFIGAYLCLFHAGHGF